MKGSDIAVVVREASGSWAAKDFYATDYVTPALDAQQDVRLISTQVRRCSPPPPDPQLQAAWGRLAPTATSSIHSAMPRAPGAAATARRSEAARRLTSSAAPARRC
jgi:hypothetical protein